ncbi:MAG: hypothetical protein M0R05_00440 [Bacilli bacterium]|nr:hypothetical protein [Bacilli bacterium]MDD4077732.1 hypothetical protein [Bacilli bacterium]MDD4388443.1 hypothetical protein [Bacilli bacterium]
MRNYRKYTEEQIFLPIVILILGLISFLMIFTNALILKVDYLVQVGQMPQYVPITDYFKGFNLAFKIGTGEVGYKYYSFMASISYFIPLLFGVLVNIKLGKVPKYLVYFVAAFFLMVIPIIYLIRLNGIVSELKEIIEIESILLGKKYQNLIIKIETGAIIHAALAIIAGLFSIYAGRLSLLVK